MRDQILVLNCHYFPIGVSSYRNVFSNLATESQYGLDIHYEFNNDGSVNFENINYWNVVRSIDEWMDLPIRPYDNFIHTVRGAVRLPTVVICSSYKGIMHEYSILPIVNMLIIKLLMPNAIMSKTAYDNPLMLNAIKLICG